MPQQPVRYTPDIKKGLQSSQVEERKRNHLYNEEIPRLTKSYQTILKDNLLTLFNLINIVLAGMIIYIGSWKNLLFLGTILCNIIIGIIQEIRSKRILDKLSLITEPTATVIRDGKECTLHMNELVLDDIMLVKSG